MWGFPYWWGWIFGVGVHTPVRTIPDHWCHDLMLNPTRDGLFWFSKAAAGGGVIVKTFDEINVFNNLFGLKLLHLFPELTKQIYAIYAKNKYIVQYRPISIGRSWLISVKPGRSWQISVDLLANLGWYILWGTFVMTLADIACY